MNWDSLLNLLIQNKELAALVAAAVAYIQSRWFRTKVKALFKIDEDEHTDAVTDTKPAEVQSWILGLKQYLGCVQCDKDRTEKFRKSLEDLHDLAFMTPIKHKESHHD